MDRRTDGRTDRQMNKKVNKWISVHRLFQVPNNLFFFKHSLNKKMLHICCSDQTEKSDPAYGTQGWGREVEALMDSSHHTVRPYLKKPQQNQNTKLKQAFPHIQIFRSRTKQKLVFTHKLVFALFGLIIFIIIKHKLREVRRGEENKNI